MISSLVRDAIEDCIVDFAGSRLDQLVTGHGLYVIKFVSSKWANHYQKPKPLKISATPALTWGTATYVTPLAYPLSSALYGRVGLVSDFDPRGWRIFDATQPPAQAAYVGWVQAQPAYSDLLLSVHSTHANHTMRNLFRETFNIDCVLFHPDQEAEVHTDRAHHVWMAVTDWMPNGTIDSGFSKRFKNGRFTVLIDEDFPLQDEQGLPVRTAMRQIERVTDALQRAMPNDPVKVPFARTDPNLPSTVANIYRNGGYLHVYIEP